MSYLEFHLLFRRCRGLYILGILFPTLYLCLAVCLADRLAIRLGGV